MAEITVGALVEADVTGVVDLIAWQEARLLALDGRLCPPHEREQLEVLVHLEEMLESERRPQMEPIVVRGDGAVRGYVQPGLWEVPEDSTAACFFPARVGLAYHLALPSPDAPDSTAVAQALFDALDECWTAMGTDGEVISWPSRDPWLAPLLTAQGFLPESVLALRSAMPLPSPTSSAAGVRARRAQPVDEDVLVALYLEEIEFHVQRALFPWRVEGLEAGFRAALAQAWAFASVEDHAPLIVAVERGGEVVAMAETYIEHIKRGSSYLPPGRYGYLNNVSVREDCRGQGVGRVLAEAALAELGALGVDGFYLYYMAANPLAQGFWPRLGFEPLVTRYQRRRCPPETH
ncbi:MAG: GNAT family N-acetyltransferase [Anaerolineae bacterium]